MVRGHPYAHAPMRPYNHAPMQGARASLARYPSTIDADLALLRGGSLKAGGPEDSAVRVGAQSVKVQFWGNWGVGKNTYASEHVSGARLYMPVCVTKAQHSAASALALQNVEEGSAYAVLSIDQAFCLYKRKGKEGNARDESKGKG